MLTEQQYALRRTPVADLIQLIDLQPSATEFLRLTYTAKHKADTVEGPALEAVASYAAAQLAQALSTYYGSDTDSTIMADAVQHQTRSGNWARLAKQLRERYYTLLNINPNKQRGTSVNLNWDLQSTRGTDRITHRNRYR